MKYIIFCILSFFFLICYSYAKEEASISQTPKLKSYIVYDSQMNKVFLQKDIDSNIYPASITKLMLLYIVFQALENKHLSLDDTTIVSKNAHKKGHYTNGSSTIFLKEADKISAKELIEGIIIASGNDAAVALAEMVYGSEEKAVEEMNKEAKLLGMNNTNFMNVYGIDNPKHYSSVQDLAIISYHIIHDYPEYYKYFALTQFTFNNVTQSNRNRLIDEKIDDNIVVDGLKTGYTDKSKYSLSFSAINNDGFRIIGIISGANSDQERHNEAKKIIQYIYSNYSQILFFNKGDLIAKVPAINADNYYIPLNANSDISIITPKGYTKNDFDISIERKQYLVAPIAINTVLATLVIKTKDNKYKYSVDILATEDIKKSSEFVVFLKAPFIAFKKLIYQMI